VLRYTLKEIEGFISILSENGTLGFHDSNAVGNDPRGVTEAIKEYFTIQFDETKYLNEVFEKNDSIWHIVHYPFCNGMTIVKRLKRI